jgi:hypothetical protein
MTQASFKDTRIIKSSVDVATAEEVKSVAVSFKVSLPAGYQDYVTTLGHGEYCGYVRVLMPSQIVAECKQYQDMWREYFFWEIDPEVITKEEVAETIAIAYTIDNDVIVFHPRNSAEIFVLPRNDDYIYKIGSSLYDALDWFCESEVLIQKIRSRFFVPWSWIEQHGHNIPWLEDGGIPDEL